MPRVSISFSNNQLANSSSFSPIGYSDKVGVINMAHQVHSSSIGLILILGSVFFILSPIGYSDKVGVINM